MALGDPRRLCPAHGGPGGGLMTLADPRRLCAAHGGLMVA
jgi:hypothetical protein